MIQLARLLLVTVLLLTASATRAPAQQPPDPGARSQPPPDQAEAVQTTDVFDLLRKLRHKELTEAERAAEKDYQKRMIAFAPVVGAKPSSGVLVGVAGNVASFRGDPKTTRISSAVASLTFSSKKQTSLTARFGLFTRDDRWHVEGDNRFLWTSQDTYGLGTGTTSADGVNMKYDYVRIYETAFRRLRGSVFAGAGFHFSAHTDVRPGEDADPAWEESPYVVYSQQHGFPLESQTSAGASLNLLADTRDNAIDPERGWLGRASYRMFFNGALGGDSTWQQLYLDARTYTKLTKDARHMLAFWLLGDFVVGGVAPYLDLPATGMDTYGRSARGYSEGRFRGERLLYGEVEYRATLMRNGLLGMVAFLNTTTITNVQQGEKLFDSFASAGGAGLRLLINRRSKTNLCLDFGFGKQGSRGVYLAVQEAF